MSTAGTDDGRVSIRVVWRGALHLLATCKADRDVRSLLRESGIGCLYAAAGQWDIVFPADYGALETLDHSALGTLRYAGLPMVGLATEDAARSSPVPSPVELLSRYPIVLLVPLHYDPRLPALAGFAGMMAVQRYLQATWPAGVCHVFQTPGVPSAVLLVGARCEDGFQRAVEAPAKALAATWRTVDDWLVEEGVEGLLSAIRRVNRSRSDRLAAAGIGDPPDLPRFWDEALFHYYTVTPMWDPDAIGGSKAQTAVWNPESIGWGEAQTAGGNPETGGPVTVGTGCTVTPVWNPEPIGWGEAQTAGGNPETGGPVTVDIDISELAPCSLADVAGLLAATAARYGGRASRAQCVSGYRALRLRDVEFASFAGLVAWLDDVRSGAHTLQIETATYVRHKTPPSVRRVPPRAGFCLTDRSSVPLQHRPALETAASAVQCHGLFQLDRRWAEGLLGAVAANWADTHDDTLWEWAVNALRQRSLSLWAAVSGTQSFASDYASGFCRVLRGLEWLISDLLGRAMDPGQPRAAEFGGRCFAAVCVSHNPIYERNGPICRVPLRMLTDPMWETVRLWHEAGHMLFSASSFGRQLELVLSAASPQTTEPPEPCRTYDYLGRYWDILCSEFADLETPEIPHMASMVREAYAQFVEYHMYFAEADDPEQCLSALKRMLAGLCASWLAAGQMHENLDFFLARVTCACALPILAGVDRDVLLGLGASDLAGIADDAVRDATQVMPEVLDSVEACLPGERLLVAPVHDAVRACSHSPLRRRALAELVARGALAVAACFMADEESVTRLLHAGTDCSVEAQSIAAHVAHKQLVEGCVVEQPIGNPQALLNLCHRHEYEARRRSESDGAATDRDLRNSAFLATLAHIAEANAPVQ